ncbi:hypothetical protein, partial [Dissulfurispira sp.]|uniref:hypothetical protein n=1 Tax=Dissulfurispira sp. TaxID=2817609 RepID=UPI002FD8AFEB
MIHVEKVSPSTLTLKCPPEIIDDLIWMLEKLVLMSRYLKRNIKYAEAQRPEPTMQRIVLCCRLNLTINRGRYTCKYVFLQKNGYSRSEAIKEL